MLQVQKIKVDDLKHKCLAASRVSLGRFTGLPSEMQDEDLGSYGVPGRKAIDPKSPFQTLDPLTHEVE